MSTYGSGASDSSSWEFLGRSVSPSLRSSLTASVASIAPSDKLSPAGIYLAEVMGKSVAGWMGNQLRETARIVDQQLEDPGRMRGRLPEDVIKKAVEQSTTRSAVTRAGVRPVIIVDIADYTDESNELTKEFKRKNFNLIPTRMVQRSDRPVVREAHNVFVLEFIVAVKNLVEDNMDEGGKTVEKLFTLQKQIHKDQHKMRTEDDVCMLKLLQEDFIMPFDKSKLDNDSPPVPFGVSSYLLTKAEIEQVFKHKLQEFSFNCPVCMGRHDIKVVR